MTNQIYPMLTVRKPLKADDDASSKTRILQKDKFAAKNLPSLPLEDKMHVTDEEDSKLCSICMEDRINMAFQCGHTCCAKCSGGLKNCHFCREVITHRIKIFI